MIFKKFILQVLIIVLGLIFLSVSINIYLNEFGLFKNIDSKNLRVFGDERTTKNLLTYKYIPNNFDGVLIGPSLSYLEMDTKQLNQYNIYNLSLNGANINELSYLVKNIYKHGNIKVLIICLDPYITLDSTMKTTSLNEDEYWQTLFSLNMIKYKIRKYRSLKNTLNDPLRDSYWGYRYNDVYVDQTKSKEKIINESNRIINDEKYKISIDKNAIKELDSLLNETRKNNVDIYAYFYPRPYDIFENTVYNKEYIKFENQMHKLFTEDDVIVNFNTTKYNYIRKNYSSYSDSGHLSKLGANEILKILNEHISRK